MPGQRARLKLSKLEGILAALSTNLVGTARFEMKDWYIGRARAKALLDDAAFTPVVELKPDQQLASEAEAICRSNLLAAHVAWEQEQAAGRGDGRHDDDGDEYGDEY